MSLHAFNQRISPKALYASAVRMTGSALRGIAAAGIDAVILALRRHREGG